MRQFKYRPCEASILVCDHLVNCSFVRSLSRSLARLLVRSFVRSVHTYGRSIEIEFLGAVTIYRRDGRHFFTRLTNPLIPHS